MRTSFFAQNNNFCAQEKRNHFSGLQGFPVLAQAPPVMFILWNRVEQQHSPEEKWIYCMGTRQKTGHVWARLRDPSEWPCCLLKMARGQKRAPSFACCPHNKSASLLVSAALPTLLLLLPATVHLWPATRFGAVHAAALCLILHVYFLQHKQQQFFVTRMRSLWLIVALALLNTDI